MQRQDNFRVKDIATEGDLQNVSGTKAGRSVTLRSSAGSVAIYSVGVVRNAAQSGSVGSDAQMTRIASGEQRITETQIGSGVQAGGALSVKSGADLMVSASSLKSGKDMSLDAGGNLGIVSRQNRKEVESVDTMSGAGVGGGMHGTSTTTTNEFSGSNVASTVQSQGKLSAGADGALLVRGSAVDAKGDVQLAADQVRIEAGKNVERKTTRTDTTTFLKLSSDSSSSASASAKAASASDSETSDKRSTEVDGREIASTTTTSKRSASASTEIETSKPVTPDPNRQVIDKDVSTSATRQERGAIVDNRGNRVTSAVDAQSASSQKQHDDGKSNSSASSISSATENSLVSKGAPGAATNSTNRDLAAKGLASAEGSAGASAQALGQAGLELSGDYAKSESRRGGTVQAGAGGAQLSAGRDLTAEGGSVKSGGDAGLTAGGAIDLKTATSNASSIGGSLQAGRESARNTVNTDKDSTESKLGSSVRGVLSQSHEGTAINSGGQIKIESGGQTSMTNTGTNAARGTVTEAAKGVKIATVKDRKDILNLGASKKSETCGTPVAPVPKAPWKAATPAKDGAAPKPADAAKVKAQGPVIGGARKPAAAKKDAKGVKPVKPVTGQAPKKIVAPSE